jgi:hypothetical protein
MGDETSNFSSTFVNVLECQYHQNQNKRRKEQRNCSAQSQVITSKGIFIREYGKNLGTVYRTPRG